MKKGWKITLISIAAALIALTVFHFVHHFLFCRHRLEPGKSHCKDCFHRKACQKYHKKKWQKPAVKGNF